jgi:hypothetical protein
MTQVDTELLRLCARFAELTKTQRRWDDGDIELSEDEADVWAKDWQTLAPSS